MEAVGDLAAGGALRWAVPTAASAGQLPPVLRGRGLRSVPTGLQHPDTLAADGGGSGDLARCLELLRTLSSTAVDDAAVSNFREAADFAAGVEEISRAAEYLQIVAAGAVDRTRREAAIAARSAAVGSGLAGWGSAGSGAAGGTVGWVTGWGTETGRGGSCGAPGAEPHQFGSG